MLSRQDGITLVMAVGILGVLSVTGTTLKDHVDALHKFLLEGFVSKPQVQKLNRNAIYVFVNGRLIRDRVILKAITSAPAR